MQIHFKKFEPDREYTLMVYEDDLDNYIEKLIPEESTETKIGTFDTYATFLNELGIYITPGGPKS